MDRYRQFVAVTLALLLSACATIRPADPDAARDVLDRYAEIYEAGDRDAFSALLHPSARPSIRRSHDRVFRDTDQRSIVYGEPVIDQRAGYTAVIVPFTAEAGGAWAGLLRLDVVDRAGKPVIWRYMLDQSDDPEAQVRIAAIEPSRWHPHLTEADRDFQRRLRLVRTADLATTAVCLSKPGFKEANPIMAPFFRVAGPWGGAVIAWFAVDAFEGWLLKQADGPPSERGQMIVLGVRWLAPAWNIALCT